MELCKTELTCVKKLNAIETSQMIKKTAVACDVRKKDIESMITSSPLVTDPILKNYNIQVQFEMAKIVGKVLSAPDLVYKNKVTYSDEIGNKGQWDNINKQFLNCKELGDWIIVNCGNLNVAKLNGFIASLKTVANVHGISMKHPLEVITFQSEYLNEMRARDLFNQALNKYKNVKFLLAILPGTSPAYGTFESYF